MKKDLKELYKTQVVPSLMKEFNYKSVEQVPKLVKISVNRGLGEGSSSSKDMELSLSELWFPPPAGPRHVYL